MGYKHAYLLLFSIFSILFSLPQQARADCTDPVAEKGSIVFNDSFSTMMFCDGTVWWDMKAGVGGVWFTSGSSDISYSSGNVGVGIDAPLSTLHVAGPLLLDNSGSCDGGGVNKGALRLNAAADALEICDGTGSWLPLTSESPGGGGGGAGSGDTLLIDWPDAIKCADSTIDLVLYLRNFDGSRVAYAPPQVDTNPQYILYDKPTAKYFSHSNMDGFDCVANAWSIANLESANRTFNLVSGGSGLSDTTNCTDGDEIFFDSLSGGVRCADKTPDAYTFADQTDVAVSTVINSNIVQITGIETTASVSVSGDGTPDFRICEDSGCSTEIQNWGNADQTLNAGDYLQLRLTSADTGGVMRSATIDVGASTDLWEVTTVTDDTPDAFAFTDQTGVELSTLTESDNVQITGINVETDISISGDGTPEYRICGDVTCSAAPAYTATAGTIDNGQYVQLRLTSSADFETLNSATLTVGGATDQWDVTTKAATCNLPWGGTITNGDSVTAYLNSSVGCGGSCTSETRTCTDGILSGSYTNSSCSVQSCASCSSNSCNAGQGSCCALPDTPHGATAGSCTENGSCSYTCNNRSWAQNVNNCRPY